MHSSQLKPREIEIGAIDTETGGLDPQRNGLVTVAIVPPKHLKDLKPLSVLIEYNKALDYDHKALEVNGFFPIEDKKTGEFFWWQTVEGKRKCVKGMPEQEALELILTYLEVYLKDSFIAGCNIAFDKSFLLEACKRADRGQQKEGSGTKPQKSFQSRLDKCLLRKTIELQTLALCAHIQNRITLPYTSKPAETKAPEVTETPPKGETKEKRRRRPSLSLNSIAKAVSECGEGTKDDKTKNIGRHGEQHDALEDATITLRLTEALTDSPWQINLPKENELKEKKKTNEKNKNISMEN
jgi:DNA polymerase III epsilon subunit-like protein